VIDKAFDRVARVIEVVLALAFIFAVLRNFANVVGRYLLGLSLLGADEVQIFIMVAMTFLGAAVVTRRNLHLRMDVLVRFLPAGARVALRVAEQVLTELSDLSATDLLDLGLVASAMGFASATESLDGAASPRGYRLLARVPRMPSPILDRVVQHFDGLQKLLAATVEDLQGVEGVGESRARSVREAISRLADASIIDRYP